MVIETKKTFVPNVCIEIPWYMPHNKIVEGLQKEFAVLEKEQKNLFLKKKIASRSSASLYHRRERERKSEGFARFRLWSSTSQLLVTGRLWRSQGEHSSFFVWFVHTFSHACFFPFLKYLRTLFWSRMLKSWHSFKKCLLFTRQTLQDFCINSSKMVKGTSACRFIIIMQTRCIFD